MNCDKQSFLEMVEKEGPVIRLKTTEEKYLSLTLITEAKTH